MIATVVGQSDKFMVAKNWKAVHKSLCFLIKWVGKGGIKLFPVVPDYYYITG